MASLTFAVKFSMAFFLLGLHLALFILFVFSLGVHTGGTVEAIALGIEVVQLILIIVRLCYYVRYRDLPSRLTHERLFFLCLWLLSTVGALWISVQTPRLLDDFAGLTYPEPAAVTAITLTWLAWTITVHLIWVVVHEASAYEEDEEPVPWPAHTQLPRISHPKRISAKIVAVAHGSDPLLWARKKNRPGQGYMLQPARPTYDPRDRRQPPHMQQAKTTYNQWYVGEAM
ncbi:hypothetical protein BC628DRAFT_724247 [Trametes gibbosa]|nr:hypothetical protein BC628DRAFT_724247 [Trametes gibbosa]